MCSLGLCEVVSLLRLGVHCFMGELCTQWDRRGREAQGGRLVLQELSPGAHILMALFKQASVQKSQV